MSGTYDPSRTTDAQEQVRVIPPSSDGLNAYPQETSGFLTTPMPPDAATAEEEEAEAPRWSGWRLAALVLIPFLLVLAVLGAISPGEVGRFFGVGVQFLPFAVLGALAFAGLKNDGARVFSYIWLAILGFGVLFVSLGYTLFAFVKDFSLLNGLGTDFGRLQRLSYDDIFKPGAPQALLWSFLLLTLVSIASIATLFRPVRAAVSRIMPIDPDNFVHKIALCILTLIFFSSLVPLIVLGGRPPLLELVTSGSLPGDLSVRPIDLLYQLVWTIPATLVVAGWPVARNFGQTMVRLGMVRPALWQVGLAVGLALLLALAATFGLDPGIRWLWETLGWQTTDATAFSSLLKDLLNPLGAVLIGVTAGIGEEMAVRGLLQPRIGLIASNLIFTAFHAYQYGFDALLSVFIIGLILGIVRARTNTTTSAIMHAVYNFSVVMLSIMAEG
jgi:membrane protease YdiL (CAAX protease family)